MVFQLPPAVPIVEVVAPASPAIPIADSDCGKNSRDCFPSDRVGLTFLLESPHVPGLT